QNLQQRATGEFRVLVRLGEPPRAHASTEPRQPGVTHSRHWRVVDRAVFRLRVGAAGREQPQEVRLPRPVRAEYRYAVAVPDLQVERAHQAGELKPLAHDGALPGAGATQSHADVLLARNGLWRSGLLELA